MLNIRYFREGIGYFVKISFPTFKKKIGGTTFTGNYILYLTRAFTQVTAFFQVSTAHITFMTA